MKIICIEDVFMSDESEKYSGLKVFTRNKTYKARRVKSLSERFGGGTVLRAKNDLGKQHVIGGTREDLAEFFHKYFEVVGSKL